MPALSRPGCSRIWAKAAISHHFETKRRRSVRIALCSAAAACQRPIMNGGFTESRVQQRLHDALYVEAMLLADEARSYFDDGSRVERDALPPMARVAFSCESLKVTTRLMHVIAWLLTQRAVASGELRPREALDPARRLGTAPVSDADARAEMPPGARRLIDASIDLHRRVARLDAVQEMEMATVSPARSMQQRLALAF